MRHSIILWTLMATCSAALAENDKPGLNTQTDLNVSVNDPVKDHVSAFIVKAIGHEENRIGQIAYLTISLENRTPNPLEIAEIVITPESIDWFSELEKCNPAGQPTAWPNVPLLISCAFKMKPADWLGTRQDSRSALVKANARLTVQVTLVGKGGHQGPILKYTPDVSIPPPKSSVFLGGVVGAMLMAFFVWIERMLKSDRLWRSMFGRPLLETALLGIRGGLLAMIAVMLSGTSHSTAAPVSLSVTDFVGGVLIGLFSYPLATWLTSTLQVGGFLSSADSGGSPSRITPHVQLPMERDGASEGLKESDHSSRQAHSLKNIHP